MPITLEQFGAVQDGSDVTPAWNQAMTAASTGSGRTVHLNAGGYTFLSVPNGIPADVTVEGEGMMATTLVRGYNENEFIRMCAAGSTLRRVVLWALLGTSGGLGLHLRAKDGESPAGYNILEDVLITGGGTWALPLFLNGIDKISAPQGMRVVHMRNLRLFNATWWAAELWNCISCEWFGGGAWQGQGSTQAIAVGGSLGQKNYIKADIDWSASTVWPGQLRN